MHMGLLIFYIGILQIFAIDQKCFMRAYKDDPSCEKVLKSAGKENGKIGKVAKPDHKHVVGELLLLEMIVIKHL